ncbi:HAD family hydrolase [Bacteroidota bacterium]
MRRITSIIWDWNGTLLDDIDLCISAMNVLLEKRNLPKLTKDHYQKVFTFPVIEYYKKLGFDFTKESFDVPAHEFIDEYNKNFHITKLQKGVVEVLEYFESQNIKQFILSAMEQKSLQTTVKIFNIEKYFEELIGIRDHFAFSKVDFGKQLIEKYKLHLKETCLIGDSTHDYEVAKELGINCILITNGHMPKERLMGLKAVYYSDLYELIKNIENSKTA